MIEEKTINVRLECIDEQYILLFGLEEEKRVNLYDKNTGQIKELFIQIMKDLLKNNLVLSLTIDESAKNGKNLLACEVSETYIEKLQVEINSLKGNEDLVKLRMKSEEV